MRIGKMTLCTAFIGIMVLISTALPVKSEARPPNKGTFVLSADGGDSNIWLTDDNGHDPRPLLHVEANPLPLGLVWSPDGNRIAFHTEAKGNVDIYMVDTEGKNLQRLTDSESEDSFPSWHPNGQRLAFGTDRDGNFEIYEMIVAGRALRNITNDPAKDVQPDWSHDARTIAFSSKRGRTISDIYLMDPNGGNLVNLTNHKGGDFEPTWSPDDSKIAWSSSRHGNGDIFVMDANGENAIQLTGFAAGLEGQWEESDLTWAPSGKKLAHIAFMGGVSSLYITDPDGEDRFEAPDVGGVNRAPSWFDPRFVQVFSVDPDNKKTLTWGWLKQMDRDRK